MRLSPFVLLTAAGCAHEPATPEPYSLGESNIRTPGPAVDGGATPPTTTPIGAPSSSKTPARTQETEAASVEKCPRDGGDLLAIGIRYSGKNTLARVSCKAIDHVRIGGPLPAVKSLESDHFDLVTSDGKTVFHGIWSNPFVPREAPMDDNGRLGWTSGDLNPPVTFELLVPNDPRGVEIVLVPAVVAGKKTSAPLARLKLR